VRIEPIDEGGLQEAAAPARPDIEAAVCSYLAARFPVLAGCDGNTPLLAGGAIDSLGVLELMTYLSDRFGIEIEDSDFDPRNLETPRHLVQLIERKQPQ
jgi:acyl carrier protein